MILSFVLAGRPLRGKSGMLTTRTGRHYANVAWKKQRDAWALEMKVQALAQIKTMAKDGWNGQSLPLNCPVKLSGIIRYPDKREADLDGVIGALGHVLERAGILTNDKLIQAVDVTMGTQTKQGGVVVRIETNFARSA